MGIHITITHGEDKDRPRWRRVTKRGVLSIALVLSLFLVSGGVAIATIPDAGTGVFHGCVNASTGALRVVDPSKGQACTGSETKVSWNQQGITWRGGWSATTAYAVGDAVRYGGSSYIAKAASTDVAPPTTTNANASWSLMASEGQTGPPGPDGKTILSGSSAPGPFTGTTGDYYLDTSTHVLYGPAVLHCFNLHCSIAWGSGTSLVGPPGQGVAYNTTGGSVQLPSGASERAVTQVIPATGDYSVAASVMFLHDHGDAALFHCDLVAANPGGSTVTLDSDVDTSVYGFNNPDRNPTGFGIIPLEGVVSLAAGGFIGINCDENFSLRDDTVWKTHIVTTQVGSFTNVPDSTN